jgi:hypothetical protein
MVDLVQIEQRYASDSEGVDQHYAHSLPLVCGLVYDFSLQVVLDFVLIAPGPPAGLLAFRYCLLLSGEFGAAENVNLAHSCS